MDKQFFKKHYRIRKAANYGKEVTIAPQAKLKPGDAVTQIIDGFVLLVPEGYTVNEDILRSAIVSPTRTITLRRREE